MSALDAGAWWLVRGRAMRRPPRRSGARGREADQAWRAVRRSCSIVTVVRTSRRGGGGSVRASRRGSASHGIRRGDPW